MVTAAALPAGTVLGSSIAGASSIWPAIGGGLASGAMGVLGGMLGNAASAKAADKAMQWQERMRATQYQATVADLKQAGLNPMLAVAQGANTTPSGQMARTADVISPAMNSAMTAAQAIMQVQQSKATADQTQAQTLAILEGIDKIRADTEQSDASTAHLNAAKQKILEEISGTKADSAVKAGTVRERIRQERSAAEAGELELPALRNQSQAAETWFGKNVAPYLGNARQLRDLFRR